MWDQGGEAISPNPNLNPDPREGKQYHRLGTSNHNAHIEGALPRRKAQPLHLTCKIGKYGIGKNAVFKFGRGVLVEVVSK